MQIKLFSENLDSSSSWNYYFKEKVVPDLQLSPLLF